MNRLIPALAVGLLIAAGAASAQAQSSGLTQGSDAAAAVITALERRLIRDYFRPRGGTEGRATENRKAKGQGKGQGKAKGKARGKGKAKGKAKHAPPGLAKRERLPPGLAKRDTLPPGLRGRGLPGDLSTALPRRQPGQELRVFADTVVLLESATGRVIDVLRNVLGAH